MDTDGLRDRWRGVAAWLDASPTEVAGLAVLLVGALAVVGVLWWSGRPVPVAPSPPVASDQPPQEPGHDDEPAGSLTGAESLTVHVAGAVGQPGLVRLPVGARVADAIEAAGGVVVDAETAGLNLAREVVDGERLDVPRIGEVTAGEAPSEVGTHDGADAGGAVRADGTLDLNRADADDLEQLPGVGPVLSQRILEWREANGPFSEVGQLRDVAGIGEKTFQSLAPLVGV